MVLRWYGVERSQGEIDFKGNGPNLFGLFPDRSGNSFSIEYNFNEPLNFGGALIRRGGYA
jgi:hypothetical protein